MFVQAEDGIRDIGGTEVQTCALPILRDAVENEERVATAAAAAAGAHGSFWSRLLNARLQLSFPQLASGVAALVVSVAAVTAVGVRYVSSPAASTTPSADRAVRRVVSGDQYPSTYVEPHEA